ncbi:MAG: HEAT repeat domain-containing protein [Asgard group archaeon]|nr:HEAT repeat domain-containing protein [Asgard group archaeon]
MNLREKMIIALIPNLKSDDWREKVRTLKHLTEFGSELKIVINDIVQLLFDSDTRVRLSASSLLIVIGEEVSKNFSSILKAYNNENNLEVKISLIDLIGKSKSKDGIPILKEILEINENDFLRQAAVESLSFLVDVEVLSYILKALKDSAANVRYAAANALRWIKSDDKIKPLINALDDNDPLVRSGAAWSLGITQRKDLVIQPLIRVLDNEEDEYVRYDILKTLGELKADESVNILIEIAKKNPEIKVRLKAIETLGEIGSLNATKGLIELFKNAPSTTIQNKINFALRNVNQEGLKEFEKVKKDFQKQKELATHQNEIQALNKYRINELQNILQNHKSISVELFSELLKIEDLTKVNSWLNSLADNLGIIIFEGIDYDTIMINTHKDTKTMYDKINKILNSFSEFFIIE